MTELPTLALELAANDDVIHVDFAGYDGGRLRAPEQAALRTALAEAVEALNARITRAARPRPAKPARADAQPR